MHSKQPLILLLYGVLVGLPPGTAQDFFKPAQYLGLKVGKDTIPAVTQKLGMPNKVFRDKEGVTWLYYSNLGPAPGKVEIIADSKTGVIDSVVVYPNDLSLKEAEKILGPRFKVIRYDFDVCLGKGGSAPLFESRDGQLEYIVYAELGVAISADGEQVEHITYLSKPRGAKKSQCQGKNTNRP